MLNLMLDIVGDKCKIQIELKIALPHCLGLPYWHYQLVLSWYLHQPETHQLSQQNISHLETLGPIDRTPGIPGSDKKFRIRSQTVEY